MVHVGVDLDKRSSQIARPISRMGTSAKDGWPGV
jgi:hypothetical protein